MIEGVPLWGPLVRGGSHIYPPLFGGMQIDFLGGFKLIPFVENSYILAPCVDGTSMY